jgi:hypothetical protein
VLAVLGLKCIATSAEETLLLFVNVIQKFRKAVQMCARHISRRDTEHSSQNRYCPAKIGTSGIPNVSAHKLQEEIILYKLLVNKCTSVTR